MQLQVPKVTKLQKAGVVPLIVYIDGHIHLLEAKQYVLEDAGFQLINNLLDVVSSALHAWRAG
eukprot:3721399-Alexandrium_andersonii.AAC.1